MGFLMVFHGLAFVVPHGFRMGLFFHGLPMFFLQGFPMAFLPPWFPPDFVGPRGVTMVFLHSFPTTSTTATTTPTTTTTTTTTTTPTTIPLPPPPRLLLLLLLLIIILLLLLRLLLPPPPPLLLLLLLLRKRWIRARQTKGPSISQIQFPIDSHVVSGFSNGLPRLQVSSCASCFPNVFFWA